MWWCWGLINLSNQLQVSYAYTPGCSGPAPTFFCFYSVYSALRTLLTILEKTPICCTQFSFWNKFTSGYWRPKHIKLHHPDHHQVACQMSLSIRTTPRRVEPNQHCDFNSHRDSVKSLDTFHYLQHLENIADAESQPLPPSLLQIEKYPGRTAPMIDCIAERCKCDTVGVLETNLQNNPYYPFATRGKSKSIQCGIKKQGIKTY